MESSETIQRLQRTEEANEVTGSFSVIFVKVICHSYITSCVLDIYRFQIDESLPKPLQLKPIRAKVSQNLFPKLFLLIATLLFVYNTQPSMIN